ncbi:MAG: glycoside hydrolase family 16 protein [Chitinophagaceae bacterium]|jgi:beta-glucanase (GH16 family)|nr:glycoside hydrolase family 16 protein [Chitinophagaceae bacterium]
MNNTLAKYMPQHIASICLLSLTVLTMAGCEKDAVQTLPQREWELTWSDEFDGAAGTAPDNTKWNYDIGRGPNNDGWGNQELQTYTNSTANVRLDGSGNLEIVATGGSGSFTSGRIKTQGKFSYGYGRYEARIKTPHGPGIWPAFWMLGDNITSVGWPQCGEIDILEVRGQEPHIAHGTIHGPGYSGGNAITKSFTLTNDRLDSRFRIYAVEWGPDYIDFFVDDYLYHRITPASVKGKGEWVFNQNFFIILNIAVGGNYVGFPTSGTPFPQTMEIDYVKVYRPK